MKERPGDQPLPTPNDYGDIQSRVIGDIGKRREVGIERYGTALQPFNGRNSLRDAYEEAMDLVMYLKQRLVEEDLLDRIVEERAHMDKEIERLAQFIIHNVPGEPSQDQGAVDTAIRVMTGMMTQNTELRSMIRWQDAEPMNAKPRDSGG